MTRVNGLPASMDFPAEELKIIDHWKEIDAFQTTLKQSSKKPRYTFYDGPPFATGLPHYGHLLAGTIKDVVTRYAHQSGFHVERRFGWDCHGLPVEYEVDKELGISGPGDVEKMGVDKYNEKCRSIVMRYSSEWEQVVQRIGRWIDFKNDYRTLYPWFMESVWWVFKQIFEKGLVYRGIKVMPFSTACSTPLSNFEAGQNYKDVQDPAVVVSFPLVEDNSTNLIAWTTTPWTLPSNLALCVHPTKTYVKIQDLAKKCFFIMMECRLASVFPKAAEYKVIEKFPGAKLKGKAYEPIFPYFREKVKNAFVVLCDAYVTEDTGTGIVHQAPYFGEDDYRVCLTNGVITKDMHMVCPVDPSGKFTNEVPDFQGQYVKDADKVICKHLKQINRLVSQATCNHNYPFCWRSDTPLIYKAVPTWFIRVESLVERLLVNNDQACWVPEFVREKRFANWLRDARDWAVSRNRYWGTPIPIWVSDDLEECVCVGSIEELYKLSGVKVTDLHKEHVDKITIPSKTGRGVLRRIPEVFDCWFESGSMPFAQIHYPFENTKQFEDGFPADFIAEGIDQTRGWFYTLLVVSTAIFDRNPFKNLIVNGIVLAENGQKMSKRLKNYPDPMEVVRKNGADALRLYLINSPVVRAQNLRFSEAGVRDVVKDVLLPWFNSLRFLLESSIQPFEAQTRTVFKFKPSVTVNSKNYMDQWILSFTQSLLIFFKEELAAYRLYTVVPRLVKFIDHLVNWYIRMNRRRLKGDSAEDLEDWTNALKTLTKVLYQLTVMMAPLTPFFTEFVFQHLKDKLDFTDMLKDLPVAGFDHVTGAPASVHYLMIPEPNRELIQQEIENTVAWMQTVVDLGRLIRTQCKLALKAPLLEGICIHPDPEVHRQVKHLESYIMEELNIRKLTVTSDKTQYGVKLKGILNHADLGKRLKKDYKAVVAAMENISTEQLEKFTQTGTIVIAGQELNGDDLKVVYTTGVADKPPGEQQLNQYETAADRGMLVLLDTSPADDLEEERLARELVNRIQRTRKKANLVPENPIAVVIKTDSTELPKVLDKLNDFIQATIKQPIIAIRMKADAADCVKREISDVLADKLIISEATNIPPSDDLEVIIFQRSGSTSTSLDMHRHVPAWDEGHARHEPYHGEPECNFAEACKQGHANIKICHVCSSDPKANSQPFVVLLENPKGVPLVTDTMELLRHVRCILGWTSSTNVKLYQDQSCKQPVDCLNTPNIFALNGTTLYAK